MIDNSGRTRMERRASRRRWTAMTVFAQIGGEPRLLERRVCDIGSGGLSFFSERPVSLGRPVRLQLQWPESRGEYRAVFIEGRVQRVRPVRHGRQEPNFMTVVRWGRPGGAAGRMLKRLN